MANRAGDWLSRASQDLVMAAMSAKHGHHEWTWMPSPAPPAIPIASRMGPRRQSIVKAQHSDGRWIWKR
ncbi:hypothetical protein [Synechococcus sp. CBW1004]|uniref:hypothetical protein n=1 Tax=Synechococcus sp. CBW1004 TaxID=1353136 RepID=UPI0018CCEAF9|nr:hypothetical protein [Synechococcus sp. CBW1004]QPN64698.1 hypothetical protein H8F25_08385 [Synechococcus sp. CBW1004]